MGEDTVGYVRFDVVRGDDRDLEDREEGDNGPLAKKVRRLLWRCCRMLRSRLHGEHRFLETAVHIFSKT